MDVVYYAKCSVILAVMLVQYAVAAFGEFSKQPHSQTVDVGEEATFTCTPGGRRGANWYFKPSWRPFSSTYEEHAVQIAERGVVASKYADKYSIPVFSSRPGHLAEDRAYNLEIHNVGLYDAGIYTCEEAETPDSTASAFLIVKRRRNTGNDGMVGGEDTYSFLESD